ncbi:alpha/beta fold hydrolase [SAR202 cluster bacterium AC-409-J13_OGT_754m]|nr:alpha/beta fold hydrolase [SAR202 cluster bacterium AC-409-J13_OGT_754m]
MILLNWRVIALFVTLLICCLYGLLAAFVVNGVSTVERWQSDIHPRDFELNAKDVEFTTRGGDLKLKGWHIFGQGKQDTIIFVHGHGGDRGVGSSLDIAAKLWDQGFNSLLFDLRGSGLSEGERVSGGYFEQDDLLGAYDYVLQTETSSGKIGILGFSAGAATAILGASKEPGIQAVVSDSTYADVSDLISQEVALATSMPEWIVPVFAPGINIAAEVMHGIKLDEMVPEKSVGNIKYPIFLIHGIDGTRIPVDHSVRVHEAAHFGSNLWKVENAGHVMSFQNNPEEYISRVVSYYQKRFSPS